MHILVAEDQKMPRMLLAAHLRKWGHYVTETCDGLEALKFISANPFAVDMLITDWIMPNLDGLELARQVRKLSEANQYIYIILLTGRGEVQDMIEGFSRGGVDDYMVKPFDPREMQMRIQVGNRLIQSERAQRVYSANLERIIDSQTNAIRQTQFEIMARLFNALETRDEETGGHVQRISIMSAHLAVVLGWEQNLVEAIRAAAPLHDIGKIGISDEVLRKPGPLTDEEFAAITRHTLIGAQILSGSRNPIIQMAEVIARSHHECWDGSGYPDGLQGLDIPLAARIVSVVDVYDALISDRVYRPGIPLPKALEIMQSYRGCKFDAVILDLFLEHLPEMEALSRESQGLDLAVRPLAAEDVLAEDKKSLQSELDSNPADLLADFSLTSEGA